MGTAAVDHECVLAAASLILIAFHPWCPERARVVPPTSASSFCAWWIMHAWWHPSRPASCMWGWRAGPHPAKSCWQVLSEAAGGSWYQVGLTGSSGAGLPGRADAWS